MSCIDAAIIKALVEHIGLNPDEIPAGGTHESVIYNAGEGINVSDDKTISVNYDTDSRVVRPDFSDTSGRGRIMPSVEFGAVTEFSKFHENDNRFLL